MAPTRPPRRLRSRRGHRCATPLFSWALLRRDRLHVFDADSRVRWCWRGIGLGAMRIKVEDDLLEISNEKVENWTGIPVERGAEAVSHSHPQFGCRAERLQRVVGIADTEIPTADLHVLIKRVRWERIWGESVDPSHVAVRLPVDCDLIEMDSASHRDAADHPFCSPLGNASFR